MSEIPRFGTVAQQLEDNGFQPIPTRWKKKVPVLDNWQQYRGLTDDYLADNKTKGVSILTAETPAIDIDVLDEGLADRIEAEVVSILGTRPPVRYGQRPKRLLLWCRGGELELSKPLRLLEFREVGLYEDDHYAVIPVGTGYGVRQKRTGHSDGRQFRTEEAAKQEIIRRQTTRAA